MSLYKDLIQGSKADISPLTLPKQVQENWVKKHNVQRHDYDRSYTKFLCRKFMSFNGKSSLFLCINVICLPISLLLFLYFLLRGLFTIRIGRKMSGKGKAVVLLPSSFKDISDILPLESLEAYKEWEYVTPKRYAKSYLKGISLLIYLKAASQHPLSGYYHLLCLMTLADYTRIIHTHSPQAIYTFADEKNFAKPLATLLCENFGIKHIGFMHGECFYQIDKGFFRYSAYYTWDKFYSELFREMRCECPMYEYSPKRISSKSYPHKDNYPIYLTYYESTNNEESLRIVGGIFKRMLSEGKKVLYRPHPRFAKMDVVREYIPNECIQDPRSVSIDDSILQSRYIASICSTVLYESFCGGKTIVVDDISDPDQHKSIIEKGFIVMSKPHKLLSEL